MPPLFQYDDACPRGGSVRGDNRSRGARANDTDIAIDSRFFRCWRPRQHRRRSQGLERAFWVTMLPRGGREPNVRVYSGVAVVAEEEESLYPCEIAQEPTGARSHQVLLDNAAAHFHALLGKGTAQRE